MIHCANALEILLAVSHAILSHRDPIVLIRNLAKELSQVASFDFLVLLLCEGSEQNFTAYILESAESFDEAKQRSIAINGSPAGDVWRTQQPLIIDRMQDESRWPEFSKLATETGVVSTCELPLTTSRNKLGTLVFASRLPSAFKPVDAEFLQLVANQVAVAIENAMAFKQIEKLSEQLAQEIAYLEDEYRSEHNFGEIVGENLALRQVLKNVETVATTDSTVMICGETGTGKELIARGVHDRSARRGRTFIKLNCAAIPTGLLESELFGHEKGAFTGAVSQKMGRFELADGGTLFLDEVGDIPLELQPKLLRVLQEQEFERLGGTKTIRVNVRLISATHRDLHEMMQQGVFRSDLYYRLNVFPIQLPPLRERRDDIPKLVRHFTQLYSSRMGKSIKHIPAKILDKLSEYSWPGNIRELQNVIERAVILSPGPSLQIPLEDMQSSSPARMLKEVESNLETTALKHSPDSVSLDRTLADTEREHILQALQRANWIVGGSKGAAQLLGLKRTTLQKKMKKLGIEKPPSSGSTTD